MSRHQYRWWDGEIWTEQVTTNGQTGADYMPFAPPPALPTSTSHDGPPVVDPLFTSQVLTFEEQGDATGMSGFGDFAISTPQLGVIGSVERAGERKHRFYYLRNAAGTPLCTLHPQKKRVWLMTDVNNNQIGEFTYTIKLGYDMLMPLAVGGYQIAEIQSTNARGTKLKIDGLTGPVATIERPKGFVADSLSTLDNYTMTRHQPVEGTLAWMSLMAPVAVDDARYWRDAQRGGANV